MTMDTVITIGRDTMQLAATLAGPLLLAAMAVGLTVSILQTITSVQEQTLTFVPKIAAVGLFFSMLLPWFIRTLMGFTTALLGNLHTAAQ